MINISFKRCHVNMNMKYVQVTLLQVKAIELKSHKKFIDTKIMMDFVEWNNTFMLLMRVIRLEIIHHQNYLNN
jgi:hypothetical protein